MPLTLLPDPAPLVVEAMLARPGITSVVADRVYTAFPDYQLWPMIIIELVDTLETDARASSARVQCNCWGQGQSLDDEAEASMIARAVQANARDLKGAYSRGAISVAAPLGITSLPDNGWQRYVVDLVVQYHP